MPTVNYEKRLEKELERIKQSDDLTDADREALLQYRRDLKAKGLRKSGFYKLLVQTRMCAERFDGNELVEATENDVKDLVVQIQNRTSPNPREATTRRPSSGSSRG